MELSPSRINEFKTAFQLILKPFLDSKRIVARCHVKSIQMTVCTPSGLATPSVVYLSYKSLASGGFPAYLIFFITCVQTAT